MIVSLLTALVVLQAAPPTAEASPEERLQAVLKVKNIQCYSAAKGRASIPLRENYYAMSPVLEKLSRRTVFLGQRVGGENKILVFSPNADGAIGLVRHTFTRKVPIERCKGEALFAPGRAELKGWGRPLTGEAPIPQPNLKHPVNHHACYVAKRGGQPFWGHHIMDDGKYRSKVRPLNQENARPVALRKLKRVPLVDCGR